ncbi:MAG: DUF86 domain-containing protein, partial [Magnetococcus sp. YQC-9]
MSREWRYFLRDIVEAGARIRGYTDPVTRDDFLVNRQLFDAVVFNLLIVGEAIKHVLDAVKREMPEVEWSMVARFRDLVAHHYFALDPDLVWEIATDRMAVLE